MTAKMSLYWLTTIADILIYSRYTNLLVLIGDYSDNNGISGTTLSLTIFAMTNSGKLRISNYLVTNFPAQAMASYIIYLTHL
ncbi:hypothetical protein [Halioxenophilus sp. WMMB6]|uniref:hypothetical protein n=1 Tax=Halioxenophilus sp. WMMB6 TaxID=3073815 RepID=UPI00295E3276|nr:hypothetical protein [Halioxenophilus sp. WMMB6]